MVPLGRGISTDSRLEHLERNPSGMDVSCFIGLASTLVNPLHFRRKSDPRWVTFESGVRLMARRPTHPIIKLDPMYVTFLSGVRSIFLIEEQHLKKEDPIWVMLLNGTDAGSRWIARSLRRQQGGSWRRRAYSSSSVGFVVLVTLLLAVVVSSPSLSLRAFNLD